MARRARCAHSKADLVIVRSAKPKLWISPRGCVKPLHDRPKRPFIPALLWKSEENRRVFHRNPGAELLEVVRARALIAQDVVWIRELADLKREAAAADAAGELIPQMLEPGDLVVQVISPCG